jgi:hypothetical protein
MIHVILNIIDIKHFQCNFFIFIDQRTGAIAKSQVIFVPSRSMALAKVPQIHKDKAAPGKKR